MSKSESSSVCCTKLQILYYSNICVVEFIVKIRRLHSEVYARVIMIMSSVINIFFFRNIPPGLLEICKVTRKQLQERDAVTRLTNWLAQVARGQVCLTRNKPLTSAPCDWADTRDTLYVACKLMHVTRHTESTWSGRKRQKKNHILPTSSSAGWRTERLLPISNGTSEEIHLWVSRCVQHRVLWMPCVNCFKSIVHKSVSVSFWVW